MAISLYTGDEEALLKQALKDLRASVISPAMGVLGHKVLENPDISEVLEAVGAMTFNLGGKTLIEIRNFAWLAKAAADSADEKQLKELMDLLENHDGEAKHILFMATKINKTVKFAKWLTSHKTLGVDVQEFKTLAFWQTEEASQRLLEECRKREIKLDPQAAALLIAHQGVSLLPLLSEIDKLATYAAGRAITMADVKMLSNHNENTFAMLADWLHGRNRAQIFHTLDELLLRQHPVPLFALVQGWLGNLYQLRYWQDLGMRQQEMAERTKKHPYKVKKDLEEFARVPFSRLEALRGKALDLEWKAKTGGLDGRLALEMLMGA